MKCVNHSSAQFQTLLDRSGLSEQQIDVECAKFLDKYGRYPNLDELHGSNSTEFVKNLLKLDKNNGTEIEKLNRTLGTDSLQESTIKLNTEFSDIQVETIPINKECIVDIKRRPGLVNYNIENVRYDENINASQLFNYNLEKLANLYGIQFIPVTQYELTQGEFKNIVPNAAITKAFVYKGNIYINTDMQSVEAPLHEMLHILLGSVRFTDPQLYFNLVKLSEDFPSYNVLLKNYPNRTRGDLNEEIFINEFAKYTMGLNNVIKDLPENILYDLKYQMKRVLDTMLFGQLSVKVLKDEDLFKMSLLDVAKLIGSEALNSSFSGSLNLKDSEVHRILANVKEDLIKKGDLKEYCS